MAGRDDDLGVGLEAQDLAERREALLDPVGIGRQAEVEGDDRRLVRAQRLDRRAAVAGGDDAIAVIGPFQLPLQALVVLDDQQDGKLGLFGHARFLIGSAAGSAAGRRMVKVVPWPGWLSTPSRPPMAAISERASNAPMPKPPGLVEEKGWNRRLRRKSESIPTPWSLMAIATLTSWADTRTVSGRVGEQASTAFWRRWPTACSRAGPSNSRPQAGVADQLHVMVAALGGDGRGQHRAQRLRLDPLDAGRRARREPREQVVHLADRALQSGHHVGPELGIVGMPLGVARDQRQLADEVLHVVQDEGEAAVEFLEPLGVGQRLLAVRLGQRAGRLAPGRAQQVEILPVERAAVFGRGEQHQPDQPVVVDQRDSGPHDGLVEHPLRDRDRPVFGRAVAVAQRVELDDPAAAFDPVPEAGVAFDVAARRIARRPVPRRRGGDRPARIGHEQQPARRVGDVGERLDDAVAERRRVLARAAEGVGEAQPFGAIVVAMLEQMLGELDLEPAADPLRHGEERRRHRQCTEQEGGAQRRPFGLAAPEGGGEDGHHRQVNADAEQRQRLEGRGARQLDPERPLEAAGQREQRRDDGHERAAQPEQFVDARREHALQISERREVELIAPHEGQAEHRPADPQAALGRGLAVDVVDQDQGARPRS